VESEGIIISAKGWVFDKQNGNRPYRAQLYLNGHYKFIGNFATPEEANAAYQAIRAANPRAKRSGGNRGFSHPRINCDNCRYAFSAHHFARHVNACQKKYPLGRGY
jgi:hypothetical protein